MECEDFRDGVYTAAIESGAGLTQAKLLAGPPLRGDPTQGRTSMIGDAEKVMKAAEYCNTGLRS